MAGRGDIGRDAGVVEVVQHVLAHDQPAAACPLLQFGRLLYQLLVVAEEVMARLPVAFHQRVPDEQLA